MVTVSLTGFIARGIGNLIDARWIRHRLARTLPHVVDTLLLASALGMLWILRLPPWRSPWVSAKILGLLVYIGLGSVALRRTAPGRAPRPKALRAAAWALALLTFGYIVSVALTKRPEGALLWL